MAKHKLAKAKARLILRDGKIRGKKLTAKQKRFFGAIAGGQKISIYEKGFSGKGVKPTKDTKPLYFRGIRKSRTSQ